jgi:hypothetical protein
VLLLLLLNAAVMSTTWLWRAINKAPAAGVFAAAAVEGCEGVAACLAQHQPALPTRKHT